ncbi:hypothetical protein [Pandoraea pulmonicola]|nr:hypothetical protein [Pandoraea pulmonicola]
MNTIDLPIGPVEYGPVAAGATSREAFFVRWPNAQTRILLREEKSNRVAYATFRVTGIAGQYVAPGKTDMAGIFGSGMHAPSGRCAAIPAPRPTSPNAMTFAWATPSDGGCAGTPLRDVAAGEISIPGGSLALSYELVPPNPVDLPSGIYRGSHTFFVGPGQDFDFGDQARVSRQSVDLEFVLVVNHPFHLSNQNSLIVVDLAPPQGWHQWFNGGKPRGRIDHHVDFGLSSGSPLQVSIRCGTQPAQDGRCVLRNEKSSEVPLDLRLTIIGATTESSLPFSRIPLTAHTPVKIMVDRYLNNAQGLLDIGIDNGGLAEMGRNMETRYGERISVIFDALTE